MEREEKDWRKFLRYSRSFVSASELKDPLDYVTFSAKVSELGAWYSSPGYVPVITCFPVADGVYVTVHLVPVLISLHETVPNVPDPELENCTIPGSWELSADLTVAVHFVGEPSATLLGEQVTLVVVGTS